MHRQNSVGVTKSRIEALRQKHAVLSTRIEEEQRRPSSAQFYLRQLKKKKLLLKEEIVSLEQEESQTEGADMKGAARA